MANSIQNIFLGGAPSFAVVTVVTAVAIVAVDDVFAVVDVVAQLLLVMVRTQ